MKGKSINMNYVKYNITIINKHKVELVGWPSCILFANPSAIGTIGDIQTLQGALTAGECKWIVQSKCQQCVHATMLKTKCDSGEVVGKRKQRSDKGKKRA